MSLGKSTSGALAMTGAALDILAENQNREEAVIQNLGANPIAVLECNVSADVAVLGTAGIVLDQYERHFVLGRNRISVIGTAADIVAYVEGSI